MSDFFTIFQCFLMGNILENIGTDLDRLYANINEQKSM